MVRVFGLALLAALVAAPDGPSAASIVDDGGCAALLRDGALRDDPAGRRYAVLVDCQIAALIEAVNGRFPNMSGRCRIVQALVARLDLSSFRSSLGPRIDGDTRMADVALPAPAVSADCTEVSFGEPRWRQTLTLEAAGGGAVVLRLADRALEASYDAPAALLVRLTGEPRLAAEEWCEAAGHLPSLDACR